MSTFHEGKNNGKNHIYQCVFSRVHPLQINGILPIMFYRQKIQEYRDAKGFNNKSLSLAAGLSETAVRDILAKPESSPRLKTLTSLASALGVSIVDLLGIQEPPSAGESPIYLDNGLIAVVMSPQAYDTGGRPVISLMVTGRIEGEGDRLYETGILGRQLLVYPINELREKGTALAFYPSDTWYNGTVEINNSSSNFRITGVVRRLSIPCNSQHVLG
jgi:transcriptional regulator with XRE-family HTH domain